MMNPMDGPVQLDFLRLMRAADALTQRAEYVRYIEEADPRVMSNELDDVLAEGVMAGHFDTSGDTSTDEAYAVDDTYSLDGRCVAVLILKSGWPDTLKQLHARHVEPPMVHTARSGRL